MKEKHQYEKSTNIKENINQVTIKKDCPAEGNSAKDLTLAGKCEKLYRGITAIDGHYIEEALLQGRQRAPRFLFSPLRAAAVIIAILVLGGATAVAASPGLREAIIRFLSGGEAEKVPFELLEPTHAPGQPSQETASIEPGTPVALGNITFLQAPAADGHFTAAYISSPGWLEALRTPSGRLIFCTQDSAGEGRTYYRLADGRLEMSTPELCQREGSVKPGSLPGVMSHDGSREYSFVTLPEMAFQAAWQQLGEDIIINDSESQYSFDIGSTFGGTKDGASIEGMYDGRFSFAPINGDTEWIQVSFLFDPQLTEYSYPFLFNLRTGEVSDPLSGVDLSAYPCITELAILPGRKSASAMAGDSHDSLKKIFIDLVSGTVTEQTEEPPLTAPVPSCHYSMSTGGHTVFYTLGDDTSVDGYLYDGETQTSRVLFRGAAWGYIWDYGFSDTYIRLIGGNHAVYYREPENEVYLMNLADGEMRLLEGVPASHDVSFLWNGEHTLLSISINSKDAAPRLAFYAPDAENAWYFDREQHDGILERSAGWYSEYGYLISAASDGGMNYLYLYQYIP